MPIFMQIPALTEAEIPILNYGDGYGVNVTPFAVQFSPVGVTVPYFALFPALMAEGAVGKILPAVQFTFMVLTSTGKAETHMKVVLANAEIQGFSFTDGSSGLPFIEIGFHWQKMTITTYNPETGQTISVGSFSQ